MYICACCCYLVTQSHPTLFRPHRLSSHQAPLPMGLLRHEYWSRLPVPSPEIFLTQGSNPSLLHWHTASLPLSHLGSPVYLYICVHFRLFSIIDYYYKILNTAPCTYSKFLLLIYFICSNAYLIISHF